MLPSLIRGRAFSTRFLLGGAFLLLLRAFLSPESLTALQPAIRDGGRHRWRRLLLLALGRAIRFCVPPIHTPKRELPDDRVRP